MIMKYIRLVSTLLLLCFLAACHNNPSGPREPVQIHLTQGSATYYGAYYAEDGIDSHVITLDLFTPSLTLDSAIRGTGYNLYIQDLFVGDATTLVEGTYAADSTGATMTYLRGMQYDQSYVGACMHMIADGKTSGVIPLQEGDIQIRLSGDSTYLTFACRGTDGITYKGDYQGILPIHRP